VISNRDCSLRSLHGLRIPGDDDDETVAIILHQFEKGIDCLRSIVLPLPVKGVSFINEKDAIECASYDVLRLKGGTPHIAAYQAGTIDLDEVPFSEDSERPIEPRAGVACKNQMQRRGVGSQLGLSSQLADSENIRK